MAYGTLDLGLVVQGMKARREAWKNGEYIFIQKGTCLDAVDKDGRESSVVINDQINERLADGSFGVFVPTQEDLLAQDWTYQDEAPTTPKGSEESRPYVSGTIVNARPMTRRRYESLNGNVCDAEDEDGYEVGTVDGYDWRKKTAFEAEYRRLSQEERGLLIGLPF